MLGGEEGMAPLNLEQMANALRWDHAEDALLRRSLADNRRRRNHRRSIDLRPRRKHRGRHGDSDSDSDDSDDEGKRRNNHSEDDSLDSGWKSNGDGDGNRKGMDTNTFTSSIPPLPVSIPPLPVSIPPLPVSIPPLPVANNPQELPSTSTTLPPLMTTMTPTTPSLTSAAEMAAITMSTSMPTPTLTSPTTTTSNSQATTAVAMAWSSSSSPVPSTHSHTRLFEPNQTSEPRKGVSPQDSSSASVYPSTIASDSATSVFINGVPLSTQQTTSRDKDGGGGKHHKNKDNHSKGLSPGAERALISLGSIGSFVLVCFIVWVIWRTVKRSRRSRRHDDASGRDGISVFRRVIPERLAARIPFLQARMWQDLGDSGAVDVAPPRYTEKGAQAVGQKPQEGLYGQDETTQVGQQRAAATEGPLPILSRSNRLTNRPNSELARLDVTNLGTLTGTQAGPMSGIPTSKPGTQQIVITPSPTESAQYATVNSTGSLDPESTMRSRMGPGMFYNQSELARQPSDAYDPARRQVNRASELSSMSSGFGDGEMMLPDGVAVVPSRPPPVAATTTSTTGLRQSTNYLATPPRFSWMRTAFSSSGGGGGSSGSRDSRGSSINAGGGGSGTSSNSGRDTVYTQASEDAVPRFRNVVSWVNQQTSRVKRGQQRAGDGSQPPPRAPNVPGQPGLPGMHNPPPEQSFGMMGDPEVARPVDEVLLGAGGSVSNTADPFADDAAAAAAAPKTAAS